MSPSIPREAGIADSRSKSSILTADLLSHRYANDCIKNEGGCNQVERSIHRSEAYEDLNSHSAFERFGSGGGRLKILHDESMHSAGDFIALRFHSGQRSFSEIPEAV